MSSGRITTKLRGVDMRFVIILLVAFAVAFTAAHNHGTTVGCPEKCRFVCGDAVDKNRMACYVPGAQFYSVAKLTNYKLDFANYPNEEWPSPTIVPSDSNVMWGATYCMANSDYETRIPQWTKTDGVTTDELFEVNVEVNVNGAAQSIKCIALRMVKSLQPPPNETPIPQRRLPATQLLNDLAAAYQKAGIPQDYIDKVKAYPSRLYVEQG